MSTPWTELEFLDESVLTSLKSTQLIRNLTALTEGSSGSPVIVSSAMSQATITPDKFAIGDASISFVSSSNGHIPTLHAMNKFSFWPYKTRAGRISSSDNGFLYRFMLNPAMMHANSAVFGANTADNPCALLTITRFDPTDNSPGDQWNQEVEAFSSNPGYYFSFSYKYIAGSSNV